MSLPVCVCIPVYNGGPTIRRTLSNLLQQEHRDFQILVYDDGSTDRTAEFVEEIAGRDSRVRLVRGETNMGRGGARNRSLVGQRNVRQNLLVMVHAPGEQLLCIFQHD